MAIKNVRIYGGYNNSITVRATTDENETMIIEVEHAEKYLLDIINEKGFITSLKPRQQYQRLTIKN